MFLPKNRKQNPFLNTADSAPEWSSTSATASLTEDQIYPYSSSLGLPPDYWSEEAFLETAEAAVRGLELPEVTEERGSIMDTW